MKCEKQIYDLLDKMTTKYVNHLSLVASQICTDKGKKTLNLDHVIQALKTMNFESHIKKLSSELDLSALQNEEKGKELIEDAQEMKDLINQQKKKNKKKKRTIEFTEEMANEQLNLFAKANLMMNSSEINQEEAAHYINYDENSLKLNGNKKMKLDLQEKNLFSVDKEEEVDFD
jgi:hypothetical protein